MVSDNIMVSVLGEELDRVSTNITNSVGTALFTSSRTQAEEKRRLLANAVEEFGGCQVGDVVCNFEFTPGAGCFGVDNSAYDTISDGSYR
jgi:hypothetical protein